MCSCQIYRVHNGLLYLLCLHITHESIKCFSVSFTFTSLFSVLLHNSSVIITASNIDLIFLKEIQHHWLFSLENIQFTPYSIISGQIEDVFLQKFCFQNRLFVYRRLLMVGTKSRGYSNSGQLSEGEYSMPFFSTRHSPTS